MTGPDPEPGAEPEDLWLGDGGGAPPRRRFGPSRRRAGVVAAVAACLAVVGIPTGLVLTSGGGVAVTVPPPAHRTHDGNGPAERQVVAALSATTGSGSFDMTYRLDAPTAPTAPTTTTTTAPCRAEPASGGSGVVVVPGPGSSCVTTLPLRSQPSGMTVSGQGTIDTDPFAMVASSEVSGFGEVTVRADGTDVWELGGGDYGLAPGSGDDGPGASLSGFAGLVEGTLGPRQGAFAMMGLASPTGYLELDQDEITGADEIGTGTVDGTPVTVYQVSLDPAQEADVPGATSVEATTIQDALAVLAQQGYTGSTVKVSIDASGYVRQTESTASFSDGTTITSEATFSDFGCAGTVLMPGQQGATTPPAGCVSPDTGAVPTTTTAPPASTTTVPPTTAPSTTAPSTTAPSTTVPPTTTTAPAPTRTTVPASTTTTVATPTTTSAP